MTSREEIDRTERLARGIGAVRREMVRRVAKALGPEGELVQWRLISAIAFDGLHSQGELAERVDLDAAATSRALDVLEARALVTRARDAADRRRVNVALTAKGRRWYERTRPVVFSELAPLFAPLSAREAKQLETLLERVRVRR